MTMLTRAALLLTASTCVDEDAAIDEEVASEYLVLQQ